MPAGGAMAGAILNGAQDIGKFFVGLHQNKLANAINPVYDDSDNKNKLALGLNMFNGRMAGATNMQNNIANAQGNFTQTATRNATDGGQLLALAAAGQGQANAGYDTLATQESQNKYALLNNLNSAYDSNFQAKQQKYQQELQQKASLRGMAVGNMFGAANDASAQNQFGAFSAFGKGFGQGNGASGAGMKEVSHIH